MLKAEEALSFLNPNLEPLFLKDGIPEILPIGSPNSLNLLVELFYQTGFL